MADKPEVIREEMAETRASLADKLETLEYKVRDTAGQVESAVVNTAEAVKETVHDVKNALNPRLQTERHPWLMMGGAVAVGYLAGYLLSPRKDEEEVETPFGPMAATAAAGGVEHNGWHEEEEQEAASSEEDEGFVQSGLKILRGLAVGSLITTLRDMATRSVPREWVSEVVGVLDQINTKLGGATFPNEQSDEGVTHDDERNAAEMGSPMGAARGPY